MRCCESAGKRQERRTKKKRDLGDQRGEGKGILPEELDLRWNAGRKYLASRRVERGKGKEGKNKKSFSRLTGERPHGGGWVFG